MTDSPGSISIPFIYIKPKSNVPEPPQKIRYTSTLEQLIHKCQNKFKTVKIVRSLYAETGQLITTIDDITPGATYLVSSKTPNTIIDDITPTQEKPASSTPIQASIAYSRLFGNSDNHDGETQPATYKVINDEEEESDQYSNHDEQAQPRKKPLVPESVLRANKSQETAPFAEEEEEEENVHSEEEIGNEEESPLEEEEEEHTHLHEEDAGHFSQSDEEDEDYVPPTEEEEEEEEEFFNENESTASKPSRHTDNQSRTLQDVINELIPDSDLSDLVPDAVGSTTRTQRDFANTAPELEQQQIESWSQSGISFLENSGLPTFQTDFIGCDELHQFATDFYNAHRLVNGQNSLVQFHSIIVGPQHSGRSTLLSLLARHMIIDLAATGNYKKTFIFIADARVLSTSISDNIILYRSMLDLVFSNIAWQLPQIKPYVPQLIKFFQSVTEYKSAPHLSQSSKLYQIFPPFVKALNSIAAKYSAAFKGVFEDWINLVFEMPYLISNAAGYSRVAYFIDDFDSIDIHLLPAPPFSMSNNAAVQAAEAFKAHLARGSFVLTGTDQRQLLDLLRPADEMGLDLRARTDIISTIGLIQAEDETELLATVQDEPRPMKIGAALCGGIGPYLQKWNEIKDLCEQVDEDEENLLSAISLMQDFITVLVGSGATCPIVTNVKIAGH